VYTFVRVVHIATKEKKCINTPRPVAISRSSAAKGNACVAFGHIQIDPPNLSPHESRLILWYNVVHAHSFS
jgi:hypothetical protein